MMMKQMNKGTWFLATATTLMLICASLRASHAAGILGGQIYGNGGIASATVLSSSSSFSNLMFKVEPFPTQFLGIDNTVGATTDLGVIDPCDELILGIFNFDGFFVTGPASRNPDNLAHAKVDWIAANTAVVEFEDLFGGGDLDFNDARVQLNNVSQFQGDDCCEVCVPCAVPEPASMSLLGLGAMGLVGRFRKRRKA